MRFDLSFWPEPDWGRESTLSPIFVMFAIAATFILVAVASLSVSFRALNASRAELNILTAKNDTIKGAAKEADRMRQRIAEWEKVVATYDGLVHKNLLWSPQLEAMQRLVPDDIILESVSISTARADDTVAADGKTPLPAWQYQMSIIGSAYGDNAQETINRFLDNLLTNETMSGLMSPTLEHTTSRGATRQFRINCRYKAR